MDILDQYLKSLPSKQNALDIFKGEWSSKLPTDFAKLQAGQIPLFEDPRVIWAAENLGGLKGKNVLELGPLEAGHTYMLEQLGAISITSVESNTRAYLKCLIIKEILGLKKVHFLLGDFIEYLRTNPSKFNFCFASGVLYHMTNPVELISLIANVSDRVYLWTHYYDEQIIKNNSQIAFKFPEFSSNNYQGFQHTIYKYDYEKALDFAGFCGGSNPYSNWLTRDDIIGAFNHFGLGNIKIHFDNPNSVNGPSISLVASRY